MSGNQIQTSGTGSNFELNALLYPARTYRHPQDVVCDQNLSLAEKRAILASWASDACAVEASPALREIPGTGKVVSVDEVLEALQSLDRDARGQANSPAQTMLRFTKRTRAQNRLRWRHRGNSLVSSAAGD